MAAEKSTHFWSKATFLRAKGEISRVRARTRERVPLARSIKTSKTNRRLPQRRTYSMRDPLRPDVGRPYYLFIALSSQAKNVMKVLDSIE